MSLQSIPDDQQPWAQLLAQRLQKQHDLFASDGAWEQAKVAGAKGEAGLTRERLPVEVKLHHGPLTDRCPGAAACEPLAQPGLVNKHDQPALGERFFY